jgi:hypothetical protein
MKELRELRERLCDELKDYSKRDITGSSLDVVDKLAHTVKNLDKIIDAYDGEYSGHYMPWVYDDGRGMNRGSYRGSYGHNRGADGRYVSRGYSRGDLASKMRELMEEAPDEGTRMDIQRIIDKM